MRVWGVRSKTAHSTAPWVGSGRTVAVLLVYRLICLGLAGLVAASILRRRPIGEQVTAGMVLIPLLLRLFLVK